MTMDTAQRIAEWLQNTHIHQESASHAVATGDMEHWCLKALVDADAPRLLAAVEAALKLAPRWKSFASTGDSQDECADELREAITAALAGHAPRQEMP